MDIVEYKGFELVPVPYQFAETSEWAVRVTITRHHDARGQSLEKPALPQELSGYYGASEILSDPVWKRNYRWQASRCFTG